MIKYSPCQEFILASTNPQKSWLESEAMMPFNATCFSFSKLIHLDGVINLISQRTSIESLELHEPRIDEEDEESLFETIAQYDAVSRLTYTIQQINTDFIDRI